MEAWVYRPRIPGSGTVEGGSSGGGQRRYLTGLGHWLY